MMTDPFEDVEVVDDTTSLRKQEAQSLKPTTKQLAFLESLLDRIQAQHLKMSQSREDIDAEMNMWFDAFREIDTRREASQLIDILHTEVKRLKDQGGKRPTADVPEGIHLLDGTYYKVQVAIHGSGHKYAKEFVPGVLSWKYTPGAITSLSDDTLVDEEQAREFGQLYGMCCFCSRGLTDERSIDVGYGPVCAEKNGLAWG
jgi:hypothetical protein